jgi:hypothetical protein
MQQHCEPEDMALLALGEGNQPCQEHALSCPQCRQEIDQLREVVTLGRASGGPDSLAEPPPALWQRISSQLDTEPVALHTDVKAPGEPAASGGDNVIPMATRKRGLPRWTGLVAAAAAGILMGGAVVATVTGQDTPSSVVASAELTPMPDGPDRGGQAEASLNRTDNGYTITVKASDIQGPEGFYEVWLLDEENSGLIALGSLAPGEKEATFPVPDGVDLSAFNAVDVSDEPLDGDPTHSTVTVLRGTLQT